MLMPAHLATVQYEDRVTIDAGGVHGSGEVNARRRDGRSGLHPR